MTYYLQNIHQSLQRSFHLLLHASAYLLRISCVALRCSACVYVLLYGVDMSLYLWALDKVLYMG